MVTYGEKIWQEIDILDTAIAAELMSQLDMATLKGQEIRNTDGVLSV